MTLSSFKILTLKGIILNIALINLFGEGGLFRPQCFNVNPLELCFFTSEVYTLLSNNSENCSSNNSKHMLEVLSR